MSKVEDNISLFKHILRVCKSHKVINVDGILRQLDIYGLTEYETELIEAVIYRVLALYDISRDQLLNSYKTRTCNEARKMCYVLIKTHLDMSEQKIALYFNRNNRVVYRAIDDYKKMRSNIKWQREFIDKMKAVDKEISLLKLKIKKPVKALVKATA